MVDSCFSVKEDCSFETIEKKKLELEKLIETILSKEKDEVKKNELKEKIQRLKTDLYLHTDLSKERVMKDIVNNINCILDNSNIDFHYKNMLRTCLTKNNNIYYKNKLLNLEKN